MSKRNIVRIKINNRSILKISCGGGRDYIFSIPKVTIDDTYLETHFTFHTKNNRKTFKVTDFGDGKRNFEKVKEEAKHLGYYVTKKDIDIFKKETITEQNLVQNVNRMFNFSYFDTGDEFLVKNFGEQKTTDESFSKIIQTKIPTGKNSVKIEIFISKNIIENPINILRAHEVTFDEVFLLHDALGDDFYMFTILVTYSKQVVKKLKVTKD